MVRSRPQRLTSGGFTDDGSGVYSRASGTAASAETAIRQLVFDPIENQVAAGTAISTTITVVVSDGGSNDTDDLIAEVTSINDAPTISAATLAASDQDDFLPPGASINSLFGASFTDVDASSNFAGIVVVGNTASAATEGRWQYSSNGDRMG